MNMLQIPNQFEAIWNKGYNRLCPIIPPGAPISERSNIFKRIAKGDDARGKIPGIKWPDGTWSGFDFVAHESTGTDMARWNAMGAGVGVKTGNGLVLIDADTKNPQHADLIAQLVKSVIGELPLRIGQAPKAGYLCRTDAEFQYTRIEFGERNERGSLQDRVEILAEGRQFVAHGIHPVTGKPYVWPDGMPALQDVPYVPAAKLEGLLAALRPLLPSASELVREGASTDIDQSSLRMPLDTLRQVVQATPNTSARFPTREAYRDYGYAIKAAAGPEHEAEGLEIYLEWASRWDDGENEPDVVEADWRRMKGPFRVGASRLLEHAGDTGRAISAGQWIEPDWRPVERSAPLFEDSSQSLSNKSAKPDDSVFEFLTMAQIRAMAPPQFLVGRHIPEQSVGVLYGEPGCGKSFLALDMALHLAYRRESWHGDELADQDGLVLYIAGEGSHGFQHRVDAWLKQKGVAEDSDNFRLLPTAVKFLDETAGAKLVRSLRSHVLSTDKPVTMIVVDTVSRSLPGADENAQKEMTLFIEACTNIQNEFKCAVMGIHHPNKEGGMRGSTTLAGACDYVFKLERKKGHPVGSMFCEKQKDAPDGWTDRYRFDVVSLGDKDSSLVPSRMNVVGEDVVPVGLEQAILRALQAAWGGGEPWAKSAQAKDRWAVKRMVNDFAMDAHDAGLKLNEWLDRGTITEGLVSRKDKKKGLRLVDFSETDGSDGAGDTAQQGAFE